MNQGVQVRARSFFQPSLQEDGTHPFLKRPHLDGLPPTIAYLDLQQYAPATLVDFLLEKLGIKKPDED